MPKWLRALVAAYGAKKLGGGCLGTIFVFVIIYFALGVCNRPVVRQRVLRSTQQTQVASLESSKLDLEAEFELRIRDSLPTNLSNDFYTSDRVGFAETVRLQSGVLRN